MKKYILLAAGLFLLAFVNFSFGQGRVVPINWDTPKFDPGDEVFPFNACPSEELLGTETKGATITNIKMDAKVIRSDGAEELYSVRSAKAFSPVELRDGDIVEAGGGSVTIIFADGSSLVMYEKTSIKYRETEVITKIELLAGKLRMLLPSELLKTLKDRVRAKLESKMKVSAACVRGTDYVMEYDAGADIGTYYLNEGSLEVVSLSGERYQLQSGEIAVFDGNGKMTLNKMEPGQWDKLIDETIQAETPDQVAQPIVTDQEVAAEPASNKMTWLGVVAVLLVAVGAGVFFYRKRS